MPTGSSVQPLNDLGLIRTQMGDAVEAMDLFDQARIISERTGHRWLGPVMTNLADVHCKQRPDLQRPQSRR